MYAPPPPHGYGPYAPHPAPLPQPPTPCYPVPGPAGPCGGPCGPVPLWCEPPESLQCFTIDADWQTSGIEFPSLTFSSAYALDYTLQGAAASERFRVMRVFAEVGGALLPDASEVPGLGLFFYVTSFDAGACTFNLRLIFPYTDVYTNNGLVSDVSAKTLVPFKVYYRT